MSKIDEDPLNFSYFTDIKFKKSLINYLISRNWNKFYPNFYLSKLPKEVNTYTIYIYKDGLKNKKKELIRKLLFYLTYIH